MNNTEFFNMIDRYHAPAKNAQIKTIYILAGIALIGVTYFAIKASTTKSKENRQLKDLTSKNLESIMKLTSKTAMLEHDQKQKESIIEALKNENKDLTAKIDKANNIEVPSNNKKI